LRAFVFTRVSTPDQSDNFSIPSQLKRVYSYLEKNDLFIQSPKDIYQVVETASRRHERKTFKEMLKRVDELNSVVALVFDTIDRGMRNFGDSVALDDLRKSNKIEVHFIAENLVINQDSRSHELLRWDMGVMFAKSYALSVSDNVKKVIGERISKGLSLGKAPYGYKNVPNDIVVDDFASKVVQKIFNLYAYDGMSIREIVQSLKEDNVKLVSSKIGRILMDDFYIGIATYKKKNIKYKHVYPQIISEELFRKAEDIRSNRLINPVKLMGKINFIYRGLIKCSICGCSMVPERHKGFHYYSCSQGRKKHAVSYVREEILTEQIAEALKQIKIKPQLALELKETIKKTNNDRAGYSEDLIKELQDRKIKLRNRLSKMYDEYLDEKISKDLYDVKYAEYSNEIRMITTKLKNIDLADKNFFTTANKIVELSQEAHELFLQEGEENNADKSKIVNLVLSNPNWDGVKLHYDYKIPFSTLVEMNQRPTWGALWDVFRTGIMSLNRDFTFFSLT
jgi:hypothetical protein